VIALVWFQALLDGIGAVLAWLYDLVPNYGIAIILLTLGIRVLLLPLAVKQMRSQQAMQAVAPKVKELQRKYKGNRQKAQEETMRMYKEEGVNPFGGCLPMFLQIPILITLFYVLQFPTGLTHIPHSEANPVIGRPQDSRLFVDIVGQRTHFAGVNLLCSPQQAGRQVTVNVKAARVPDAPPRLDCGSGAPSRIPYYLFLVAMVGTQYFSLRQMQRVSPPGSSPQQQMITRFMPILFGIFGLNFPAGLLLYWTTTNVIQIIQQHVMLPAAAVPAAGAGAQARGDGGKGARRGTQAGTGRPPAKAGTKGSLPRGQAQPKAAADGGDQGGKPRPKEGDDRPSSGAGTGSQGGRRRGAGGRNAGDRKKRRKR
jgi:YidC/Oxa1 family membrane protein insertase